MRSQHRILLLTLFAALWLAAQTFAQPVPFKSPVMQQVWASKTDHSLADATSPGLNPAASPFLTTPPLYPAGSHPFDLALGDFNADANLDVIVAANPPVLLLGNGDGTLQAAAPIGTIASAPTGVAVGDFNRDGNLDVVFAISGGAVVYLGNGHGTFGAATTFSSSGTNQVSFARVLVADVNNDGILDLILNTDTGLSVLLGNGNGSFQGPIFSGGNVQYLSAADFNKDGNVDLAITNGFTNVSIMLGNGHGTFLITSTYSATPQHLNSLAIGDYNQDGFPDVALPNGQLFFGNGDGTLKPPGAFPTAPHAIVVSALDVNGDGVTDLLTASFGTFCGQNDFGTTGVSLGKGDGTFQSVALFDSGGCSYPLFMAVGDLNNDGAPDILLLNGPVGGNFAQPGLGVLINKGDATLPAAELNISGGSGGIAVNDFNNDGNADAVLADGSIYLGNGNGKLRFLTSVPLGGVAVVTGDFNNDGNPDLAAAVECAPAGCSSGGQLLIAAGNGNGTFQAPTALPSGGFYAESLVIADFNNDGNLDIALVNNCSDSACSDGGSVSIFLGTGNGSFLLAKTISLPFRHPSSIVAGDFNNDGAVDLAVGMNTGFLQNIDQILLGNGDGSFQSPISLETPDFNGVTAVAAGDFNNDGILDLSLAEGGGCSDCGGHGRIMYGNGDGTFSAAPRIPTEGGPPVSVVAADFYGTGTLTSVLANRCGDVLDCPFGSVMIQGTANQTDIMLTFLAVGDFNNDGKPDVVGSLQYDLGLSVLLNNGAARAATTTTISPSAPQSFSVSQPITFTASVHHTGQGTPTGTLQFSDRGVSIGAVSIDSSGQASLKTTALAVGSHFVTAYYQGDSNFAPSNSLGVHITIGGCPAGLGFWKQHVFPDSVQASGLTVGSVTYSASDLLTILENPGSGNAITILGPQLVAALLNKAAGAVNNPAAEAAISTSETLLSANSLNLLNSFVAPSSALGQALLTQAAILDGYNGGDFHTCSDGKGLLLGS
jgi:hypothetical protein